MATSRSAALIALAAIALAGCKSEVAQSPAQALPSCGANEVLTGPSSAWTCTATSSLDAGTATSAVTALSAGSAVHVAIAPDAQLATHAAHLSPGTFQIGNGTIPFPADAGVGPVELNVAGGSVITFADAGVYSTVFPATQTTDALANGTAVAAIVSTTNITVNRASTMRAHASGFLTGNGTITQPVHCLISLEIIGPSQLTPLVLDTDIAAGFEGPPADAGEPNFPGFTNWYVEGSAQLAPGVYSVVANLSSLDGASAPSNQCSIPFAGNASARLVVEIE